MNHQEAVPLLSDLLADRVEEPGASAAWAHVAECPECRQVLTTLHEVRAAVAAEGRRLFSRHPSTDEIVRFAVGDPPLGDGDAVRMEHHLKACTECRNEVELTRRADEATRSESPRGVLDKNPFAGWWPRLAPALTPALAALALVLAFPAYRGFVNYPSLERAFETSQQDAKGLKEEGDRLRSELAARPSVPEPWSGAVRLLVLRPAIRGADSAPVVELAKGQPYQPVVIEQKVFPGNRPAGSLEVVVTRVSDGVETWRAERETAALWDPALSSLVLLVPTSALGPGLHRIQVVREGEIRFESEFDVQPVP